MLETIPEVPEIEMENGVVISGESDVSQSTLAESEDSTINTEDFTIDEDSTINVNESEFIEIETALKSVEETFQEIEKNIAEIEEDIEQSELEINAMELGMMEIEKTYTINDEISLTKETMSDNLIMAEEVEDNEIVRYFAANFLSRQLSKRQQLIGVLYFILKLSKVLIRDIV